MHDLSVDDIPSAIGAAGPATRRPTTTQGGKDDVRQRITLWRTFQIRMRVGELPQPEQRAAGH